MDELAELCAKVLDRTAAWTTASWAVPGRVELMYAAVQTLADLAAGSEGRPARPVPCQPHTVLPDQLCVMVADLAPATPSVRRQAATVLSDLAGALGRPGM